MIAFAKDQQSWSDAELRDFSEQIRRGDLTPVLKVYERNVKNPVRRTLIRSLLIQVQKAKVIPDISVELSLLLTKVDMDYALARIDKLLRL